MTGSVDVRIRDIVVGRWEIRGRSLVPMVDQNVVDVYGQAIVDEAFAVSRAALRAARDQMIAPMTVPDEYADVGLAYVAANIVEFNGTSVESGDDQGDGDESPPEGTLVHALHALETTWLSSVRLDGPNTKSIALHGMFDRADLEQLLAVWKPNA